MKKIFTCVTSALLMSLSALFAPTSALADDKAKDEDRLKNCGTVLKEILDIPDDVPKDLLDKADCVVVFPSGKDFSGPWGAPSMMGLEGGSFGFQLGGQATDFVLLVMYDRGANGMLLTRINSTPLNSHQGQPS